MHYHEVCWRDEHVYHEDCWQCEHREQVLLEEILRTLDHEIFHTFEPAFIRTEKSEWLAKHWEDAGTWSRLRTT